MKSTKQYLKFHSANDKAIVIVYIRKELLLEDCKEINAEIKDI